MSSTSLIEGYLSKSLPGLRDNANRTYSYSDLRRNLADDAVSKHVLGKMYPASIASLHKDASIYIHDRSDGIIPYCFGDSLYALLLNGLWTPSLVSKPAKHFSSALNHVKNKLCITQKEFAGAQAFADFNTLLAPLVWKDNLSYDQVKQGLQETFFDLNYPSRWSEPPFTNIMFNWSCPSALADEPVVSPGLENFTYKDFPDESLLIIKAANDVYMEGDAAGNPMTFPIPTINLTPDIDWKDDLWSDIADGIAKYGLYNFMNYIGTGYTPGTKRSMCCRLNMDMSELSQAGGRWALDDATGSLGIVTINFAQVGYLAKGKDESALYERIGFLMEKAKESLAIKTSVIEANMETGLFPISKHNNISFKKFFRTIGGLGFDEMFMNYNGTHIWDNAVLMVKIMEYIREKLRDFQRETGLHWNFEQTPGESSSNTLALRDLERYPDAFHNGTAQNPYYSTLLIPPSEEKSLMERIRFEENILPLFSGGTVHRIFMGEAQPDPMGLLKLVRGIAEKSRIPYFDIAATYSVCPNHGYTRGNHELCPTCGSASDVYSRITGYYKAVNRANPGKVQEWRERQYVTL